jgi:hypothetical protein
MYKLSISCFYVGCLVLGACSANPTLCVSKTSLHCMFGYIMSSVYIFLYTYVYKYVYEDPTRCNGYIFVLFQDLYMFRVPAVPIIRSTILQLTVTGITRCNTKCLYKMCVEGDILYKISPSTHFLFKNFMLEYVIPVNINCSIVLLMMGTASTRNM